MFTEKLLHWYFVLQHTLYPYPHLELINLKDSELMGQILGSGLDS